MSVKIEYLLKNQNDFIKEEIPYKEYFDLEENEKIKINSVPIFSQPYLYLKLDIKDILLLKLYFEINNEIRIFKQTFWNNGENILTERIDIGRENYREIIFTFKLNNMYETVRLHVGSSFIVPIYHGLFLSDKCGKEIEQKFDTNVYLEMIKQGTFY